MDWRPDEWSSPAMTEGSGDSELLSEAAAEDKDDDGGYGHEDDGDDDDDAESCNHGAGAGAGTGVFPRGDYVYSDDDGGDGDEGGGLGYCPPLMSRGSWLAEVAGAGCKWTTPEDEDPVRGDDDEVAMDKKQPAAGAEDRLFWEACLARGYP